MLRRAHLIDYRKHNTLCHSGALWQRTIGHASQTFPNTGSSESPHALVSGQISSTDYLLKTTSELLKCFVTKELMRWQGITSLYGERLRQSPLFASDSTLGKKTGSKAEGRKADDIARPGEARWEDLHKRVVEHVHIREYIMLRILIVLEHSCDRRVLLATDNVPLVGAPRLDSTAH